MSTDNKRKNWIYDFNLKDSDEYVISRDSDVLGQEIDILFDSTPGDLHGDIEYGTDYEYLLFELKLSTDQLEEKILKDITSLDLRGFTPEVSVAKMQGTERDIVLFSVTLSKNYEKYTKTYKIT